MQIGITGASGLIGQALVDLALRRGHEVTAFSRTPERPVPGCTMRRFSLTEVPDLSGCEAVVHLAAESVVGMWTKAKQRRIVETRVQGTRRVAEALRRGPHPPEVFVCGSAIGYYGNAGETELREDAPNGTGFLAETVRAWEAEAIAPPGCRTVLLRTAVVLAREAGALAVMRPFFRAGLGAQIGDGQQWLAWIHVADIAALTLFAVEDHAVQGPLNGAAPWPVRNREWTQALAHAVHRPAWLRAPVWAVGLAGEFSREVLDSKRVVPAQATERGFRFKFPELPAALKDLLG